MNKTVRLTAAAVVSLSCALAWPVAVMAQGGGDLRNANGQKLGRIYEDGTVRDANGQKLGSVSGGDRRAALTFFFD